MCVCVQKCNSETFHFSCELKWRLFFQLWAVISAGCFQTASLNGSGYGGTGEGSQSSRLHPPAAAATAWPLLVRLWLTPAPPVLSLSAMGDKPADAI